MGDEMAYELSIERDTPLTIDEWRAAVEAEPALRYGPIDSTATNPRTGATIVVKGMEGDASMEVDGRQVNVFRWYRGRVTFKARAVENASDPVSKVAFVLARRLGAVLRGEEGEIYAPPS